MMGKATVNLQDSFLNQVRKENSEIEMVLVNGTHLTGLVRGFDNFTVVVNAAGKQHLVYKHAIAQIVSQRPVQDFSAVPQNQSQPQQPREQREPREQRTETREPREQREPRGEQREARQPQSPRPSGGDRPSRTEPAPAPEQRQQPPRPNKPEQPQQPRDKFNVLDLRDVKLDQGKS